MKHAFCNKRTASPLFIAILDSRLFQEVEALLLRQLGGSTPWELTFLQRLHPSRTVSLVLEYLFVASNNHMSIGEAASLFRVMKSTAMHDIDPKYISAWQALS